MGGGYQGNGGTTILTGGTTTATGDNSGAGIGGGQGSSSSGVLDIHGIGAPGAATNGGDPNGALITNSTTPAGIGYTAATATVGTGGQISVEFVRIATFDAVGGTATDTAFVAIGDTLTAPADPTRAGYTFAGWTVSGAAYDFTNPVTASLTLIATWTEVPATVDAPATDATLAATGSAITPHLSVGAILLMAGFALLVLRRRVTARQR
ncbi:LPXTG cell wall anchor domain-containing protein [Salinibacterium amurskyense]|nr:LPXTG cell wall anchor domain-containing protein [Salinibacterium amurskyense]